MSEALGLRWEGRGKEEVVDYSVDVTLFCHTSVRARHLMPASPFSTTG